VARKDSNMNAATSEFEKLGQEKQANLIQEFTHFLSENKKWWLAPIVIALGIVGVLVILASTGAAPFIYTLF
jgi:hypothetical protein